MREVRRKMLEGEEIPGCEYCYEAEKISRLSHRIITNERWASKIGTRYEGVVDRSRRRNLHVEDAPRSVQIILGNKCNLRCRICFPVYSSCIERDKVHMGLLENLDELEAPGVDWAADPVVIGPKPRKDVLVTGMHPLESHHERVLRWTNGHARLRFTTPGHLSVVSLLIRLWPYHPAKHRFGISVNREVLYEGTLPCRSWERRFSLKKRHLGSHIDIDIKSDTFRAGRDSRRLGVAVEKLELTSVPLAGVHKGHRFNPGHAVVSPAVLHLNLLKNTARLKCLYVTGGEPMIQEDFHKIIDFILERDMAKDMVLELNTNGTVFHDKILEKLAHFRHVRIGMSIDARGPYYEYIRYPASWEAVSRNVTRMVQLPKDKFTITGICVLHVYNLLNLDDLIMLFHDMGVHVDVEILSRPWPLAISVLPPSVRKLAADRLRCLADRRCMSEDRQRFFSLAEEIELLRDSCSSASLEAMMHFTNRLDASRHQDFKSLHGELIALLAAEGFHWNG